MEQKKKKLGGQQGELMRALNITMDDLIANDEGYIPDEQKLAVLQRQSYQWQQFRNITLGFAVSAAFCFMILLGGATNTAPVIGLGALFLLLSAFFGIIGINQRLNVKRELEKGKFETTQGIAVVNVSEQKSHIEINGLKLNASPDVLRRVKHLDPYIIHYLPDSNVVLSMEHITGNDNIREDAAQSRLRDEIVDDGDLADYDDSDALQSHSSS